MTSFQGGFDGVLAPQPLSNHMPDPRRPAIRDTQERNLYFQATTSTSHADLTEFNQQTTYFTEAGRVRAVHVDEAGLVGGFVSVQVYVGGVPIFDEDGELPRAAHPAVGEPTAVFNAPAGTPITTEIRLPTPGVTGVANVLIDTEAFVLIPPRQLEELKGRDRLSPSKRRRRKLFELTPRTVEATIRRQLGALGPGTSTEGDSDGSDGGGSSGGGGGGGGDVPSGGVPPIFVPPGTPGPTRGG